MGSDVTDVGLEKKSVTRELKKHAATIHCSNTLSLLQRKISNALLYHAYKELMLKEEHAITVKELCKLISYSGNNHAAIKDALKGLLSTVIEWNVVNDTTGTEDWTASSILASVSLKGPLCFYAYSVRMKQLLHSPTMFGKINLFIQSRFKSSYGLALYENCIRYRGLGLTKWFDMETFRKLMGVPTDKYIIFRDFKRRVLDKSVEEVNTYSDLIVVAEVGREGRQVNKIRFSLKERAKKTRLGGKNLLAPDTEETPTSVPGELVKQLLENYGLSAAQAQAAIDEYGEAVVREKMLLIEASSNYQQGKVHNLAAYFFSALKNNYQAAKTSQQIVTEHQQVRLQQSSEQKKLQATVKKIRAAYLAYREQALEQMIQDLPAAEYATLLEAFQIEAASAIRALLKLQRHKYTAESVLHAPQIRALLRQFALRYLPHLAHHIRPFTEFLADLPAKSRAAWQELSALEPMADLLQLEY